MVTVARWWWWLTRLVSLLGFSSVPGVSSRSFVVSSVCVFICVSVGRRRVGFSLRVRQTEKNKKKRGFFRREKHLKLRLEICNLSPCWRGLLRWALHGQPSRQMLPIISVCWKDLFLSLVLPESLRARGLLRSTCAGFDRCCCVSDAIAYFA